MRKFAFTLTFAGTGLLALATGCAKPPTIEVTDAENAVNAADQAGALEYTTADFEAAKEALADAKTKIEAKDYKTALALALAAKARAEAALAALETGKIAAKRSAEEGIGAVEGELEDLEGQTRKLKGAAAAEMKKRLGDLQTDWTRVKEDFLDGSYTKVNVALKRIRSRVEDIKSRASEGVKSAKGAKKK